MIGLQKNRSSIPPLKSVHVKSNIARQRFTRNASWFHFLGNNLQRIHIRITTTTTNGPGTLRHRRARVLESENLTQALLVERHRPGPLQLQLQSAFLCCMAPQFASRLNLAACSAAVIMLSDLSSSRWTPHRRCCGGSCNICQRFAVPLCTIIDSNCQQSSAPIMFEGTMVAPALCMIQDCFRLLTM